MSGSNNARIADELMAVLGTGRSASRYEGLAMADAYAVCADIRTRRERRGERVLGRKIGFTNTTIWPLYGVSAPMWNYVYDTTVHDLPEGTGNLALSGLSEPRIEPEIVLGLGQAPRPGMSEAELLGCVAWVAPGFEIVQSVFPGWKLSVAESAAAYGLHGALAIGPRQDLGTDRAAWVERLGSFTVTLRRNGEPVAEGTGSNVLGSPLRALGFLADEIARHPVSAPLTPGEIITTGTLTDAQPAAPGETWSTEFGGIALGGISLTLR